MRELSSRLLDGFHIGTLCVIGYQPCQLSPSQLRSLVALSKQVILTIEQQLQKEKLRIALHNALYNEKYFREVFNYSPVGIIQLNSKLEYIQVNPAYEEILGYSQSELKGRTALDFTHPDDVQLSKDVTHSIIVQSKKFNNFDKRYVTKSGKTVWCRVLTRVVDMGDEKRR